MISSLTVVLGLLLSTVQMQAARAADAGGTVGSTQSAAWTPWVRDGQVLAIAQVGQIVVLGGNFTSVSPPRSEASIARRSLVAFDAGTGEILPSFAPVLNGPVQALEPGPVAGTVYAGGSFTTVNGVARKSLVLLDLSTGLPVTGWASPYLNGAVQDIARVGSRLVAAGTFTAVGKNTRNGLASFNPTTGAFDPWMTVGLTENNNWTPGSTGARAGVGAENIDVSPDGRTMVVIGNFRKAGGLDRRQAVLLDVSTTPSVRLGWRTSSFSSTCSANSFDSWVRDVDISPDGSFFVVATTGGPYPGTLCDTASRWNTADTGTDVKPVWTSETGGDTLFSVAVTNKVVYAGGHQRWANNPDGRDNARGGAVPRPGIVALDPESGIPFTWNPGRNPRGIGTTALLATDAGLWVGSDTEWIGNFQWRRMRIAFFPHDPATVIPGDGRWTLPASIYQGGGGVAAAGSLVRRYQTGTRIDWTDQTATPGVDWTTVRGAFVVDGVLFTGASDGLLYRRTFDGTTAGAAQLVDPYNDAAWSTVATGSGTSVYRGLRPSFYGTELAGVTGMTYASDRIFYTLTGSTKVYWRWFNPESGIVGPKRLEVAGGTVPSDVRGLFAADGHLWYAHGTGQLSKQRLDTTSLVAGTTQLVGGPTVDGVDWRGRALFPGPGTPPPANAAPVASWSVSCAALACTFDGSASTDPEGSPLTYSWTFGDGGTATGASATHTFAAPGTYQARLVVTDSRTATGSSERSVTVSTGNVAPTASFTASCTDLVCSLDARASSDVDGSVVAYDWAFGDGSSGTGSVAEHAFPATGTYRVAVTVTDTGGATATSERDVAVTAAPATIAYRAGSTAQSGGTSVATTVPAGTQPGDGMLLFATVNATTPAVTAPSGWTEVRRQASGTMVTVLWSRVALSGDAGAAVTVGLSVAARSELQLAVYSGTDTATPVDSAFSAADISTATHTTPTATVQDRSSYVVSFWADKSTTTTAWSTTAAVAVRGTTTATGSGRVTSLLADGGAAVPAGSAVGGVVATTMNGTSPAPSSRATTWTVVLQPAAG